MVVLRGTNLLERVCVLVCGCAKAGKHISGQSREGGRFKKKHEVEKTVTSKKMKVRFICVYLVKTDTKRKGGTKHKEEGSQR